MEQRASVEQYRCSAHLVTSTLVLSFCMLVCLSGKVPFSLVVVECTHVVQDVTQQMGIIQAFCEDLRLFIQR